MAISVGSSKKKEHGGRDRADDRSSPAHERAAGGISDSAERTPVPTEQDGPSQKATKKKNTVAHDTLVDKMLHDAADKVDTHIEKGVGNSFQKAGDKFATALVSFLPGGKEDEADDKKKKGPTTQRVQGETPPGSQPLS